MEIPQVSDRHERRPTTRFVSVGHPDECGDERLEVVIRPDCQKFHMDLEVLQSPSDDTS